jgi:hypothetical protein
MWGISWLVESLRAPKKKKDSTQLSYLVSFYVAILFEGNAKDIPEELLY